MAEAVPPPESAPVISLGNSAVTAPVVRTGLQFGAGQFLVEGVTTFHLVHLTADQEKWLGLALSLAVCAVQNFLEKRANRKLLGRAPAPAVVPPAPDAAP